MNPTIRICYINDNGLENPARRRNLRNASENRIEPINHVYLLVETNQEEIEDRSLFEDSVDQGFCIFRSSERRQEPNASGGVLIAAKRTLEAVSVISSEGEGQDVQYRWIQILLKDRKLNICVFHIHPLCSKTSFEKFFNHVIQRFNSQELYLLVGKLKYNEYRSGVRRENLLSKRTTFNTAIRLCKLEPISTEPIDPRSEAMVHMAFGCSRIRRCMTVEENLTAPKLTPIFILVLDVEKANDQDPVDPVDAALKNLKIQES